jgi:hypothetical protein
VIRAPPARCNGGDDRGVEALSDAAIPGLRIVSGEDRAMLRHTALAMAAALAVAVGPQALAQSGGSGSGSGDQAAPPSAAPDAQAKPPTMSLRTDVDTLPPRASEEQRLRAAMAAAWAIMLATSERRGTPAVARAE